MNNNKKGVSAIVATVLIILITVAGVAIVWAAIIPMITSQLEMGTMCFDAISQIQLTNVGYTCYHSTGDNVSLQIKRLSKDFDLVDVQVLISSKGNTYSYDLIDSATTVSPVDMNASKLPGTNEERVYVIDTSGMTDKTDMEKIQIAPVIGNTAKTCDSAGMIMLSAC